MRISAKCIYASKALLELSLHWPKKEPLAIQKISERQNIPMKYLVHILIQLKSIGLVDSTRGKEGGYTLTKSPDKINLGEVMREIQGPLLQVAGSDTKDTSVFVSIWEDLEDTMTKTLDKVNFKDIRNKAKKMESVIVYQI